MIHRMVFDITDSSSKELVLVLETSEISPIFVAKYNGLYMGVFC